MGLQLCEPTSHSSFPTGWKAEGGDSSPEQYGPRLCQFLCVSLAQGEREGLYLFWLYMLNPLSFGLQFGY